MRTHFKFNSLILLSLMITTLLLVSGCGVTRRLNLPSVSPNSSVNSTNYGITQYRPKSYVVYPFKNTAFRAGAAPVARRAFHSQFALLGEVRTLDQVDQSVARVWSTQDAVRVARALNADAVVLGEVLNEESTWLVFFTGSYYSVAVKVYDTQTGRCIYQGQARESDFSMSPFIIPEIIGNVTRERTAFDCYNNIASDIVNDINNSVYNK